MKKREPLDFLKELIRKIPFADELYWYLQQANYPPPGSFSLHRVEERLPQWCKEATKARQTAKPGKKVFVFAAYRPWMRQMTLTGLALAGLGHDISFGYLPYTTWQEEEDQSNLKRQDAHIEKSLELTKPLLQLVPMRNLATGKQLPHEIIEKLEELSLRDVKYSLLREDVERDSDLYRLRMKRNSALAKAALTWMENNTPDVVVVPNGSVLEFGVIFHIARYLGVQVVTYEFGEQHERMWLAQNRDVMRQETDQMWDVYHDKPLTEEEWERIKKMFSARQGVDLWENSSRQWQKTASQGEEKVRAELGLDQRPIVFIPTNVLGDSLTLGRQIFSKGMTEWLTRTIQYFIDHPQYQLVIRIHPGEQLGWGPSVYEILESYFENLPEHIHIIPADAAINSYDLVEAASFATVFTTTLGMEMAMSGLSVIVVGETHYRKKGFTLDPNSWKEYFDFLVNLLENPTERNLSKKQVEQAWIYAYRFFFDYPRPFPWHVQHFWENANKWPLEKVLSQEGRSKFEDTFRYLVGEPMYVNEA